MTQEEKEIIDSVLKHRKIVRYQSTIAQCMLDAMRAHAQIKNAEYIEALTDLVDILKWMPQHLTEAGKETVRKAAKLLRQ